MRSKSKSSFTTCMLLGGCGSRRSIDKSISDEVDCASIEKAFLGGETRLNLFLKQSEYLRNLTKFAIDMDLNLRSIAYYANENRFNKFKTR
mmetsp:Transcript_1492/g.3468  ORF Transcript_1492/g.3468 Transcript_1492/m.3468 type:complete len:91 (+) Transcript_1492:488-760(+)